MRSRPSGRYLAFFIMFLIINVVPFIFRNVLQYSDGLPGVSFNLGNLSNILGMGAIIAVVVYFIWAKLKPNGRSFDKDGD